MSPATRTAARQVTYRLVDDLGRAVGYATTRAGRHGEPVEYGARQAGTNTLRVYGTGRLVLISTLSKDEARTCRNAIRRANFSPVDVSE